MTALTVRCLTSLATPQKLLSHKKHISSFLCFCASLRQNLAAATRVELVSSRLQDERSGYQLSYAAIWWTGRDSNPHVKFAGLLCCRLHHQPEIWWLWVELNHQPRAYETLALFPLSYTAVDPLEARGGVEPRAFPPSSRRFGLEDRCRVRGPRLFGRGVRPTRLCKLHAPGQSPFCRDESRPDNLVPKEGLKPSTSGL